MSRTCLLIIIVFMFLNPKIIIVLLHKDKVKFAICGKYNLKRAEI